MSARESGVTRMRDTILARVGDGRGESGVALLSAVIFMIIMAGISVVLLSTVLGQIVPSKMAQSSTRTIYAAQAGMQASLGILRSVSTTDPTGHVFGDKSELPCSLDGQVDAQDNGVTYEVTISYFTSDPTGTTGGWQVANKLGCSSGSGVGTQPSYALISSTGLTAAISGSTAGARYLSAVYKFKISNVNVAGGRIFDRNNAYCLQATTPTAGSLVTFRPLSSCTTANDDTQLWVYDKDYQIKLASTIVGGAPGVCITGPVNDGEATQNAKLAACLTSSDAARWNQLWSWTGDYSWRGQKKIIGNGPSTYCLATGYADGSNLTDKPLLVSGGCSGTFAPSTAVGAGAAGYATHQIVNYKEFGRCADVTGEDINASYMISYPCKQDPTGTSRYLLWNHKWFYSEPAEGQTTRANQEIYVYYLDSTADKRCLETAGTGSSYVTFKPCTGASTGKQKWTRVYDTGVYVDSYVIKDNSNRCLTADPNPSDLYNGYSKVTVATCNGSLAQKWNAPPTYTDSTVGGYREVNP